MQFRWAAFIALWTCFIAPIIGAPSGSGTSSRHPSVLVAKPSRAPASRHAAH